MSDSVSLTTIAWLSLDAAIIAFMNVLACSLGLGYPSNDRLDQVSCKYFVFYFIFNKMV